MHRQERVRPDRADHVAAAPVTEVPESAAVARVLALQRTAGNAAVGRLLSGPGSTPVQRVFFHGDEDLTGAIEDEGTIKERLDAAQGDPEVLLAVRAELDRNIGRSDAGARIELDMVEADMDDARDQVLYGRVAMQAPQQQAGPAPVAAPGAGPAVAAGPPALDLSGPVAFAESVVRFWPGASRSALAVGLAGNDVYLARTGGGPAPGLRLVKDMVERLANRPAWMGGTVSICDTIPGPLGGAEGVSRHAEMCIASAMGEAAFGNGVVVRANMKPCTDCAAYMSERAVNRSPEVGNSPNTGWVHPFYQARGLPYVFSKGFGPAPALVKTATGTAWSGSYVSYREQHPV